MSSERGESMLKKLLAAALCAGLLFGLTFEAGAVEMKRFTSGGMELIALADVDRDQGLANKTELLIGMSDAEKAALPAGIMANAVNCFIVKVGQDVLLFDTGFGGDRGHLVKSMAEAGVKPEDVTAVLITHFHPDHIGGLVKGGEAAFPNARLMVPRVEVEAMAQAAMTFIPAYAGRLHTFEWEHPVSDGVVALEAAGHTPGHTVFELDAGGGKLWILGDLIHFGAIQLPRPEVAVTYDTDPVKAVAARKRIFDMAAERGVTVAAMHLPFPGVGTLSKSGEGYAFEEAK